MFYMKLSGDLNALTQGALSCVEVSIHFLKTRRDGAHRSWAIEQVRGQCCPARHSLRFPTREDRTAVKMVMATGLESYHLGCKVYR